MAGYAYLNTIPDEATRRVVKDLMDEINRLRQQVAALETTAVRNTTAIDANGQRVTNLATPTQESDAVTVAFLRAYVQAQVGTF